jgi:hypothetical protein
MWGEGPRAEDRWPSVVGCADAGVAPGSPQTPGALRASARLWGRACGTTAAYSKPMATPISRRISASWASPMREPVRVTRCFDAVVT